MQSAELNKSIAATTVSDSRGRFYAALGLALMIAAAHGLATWISSSIHYPEDSLVLRTMTRPGGDPDYYPQLRHFAEGNLGESSYLETRGEGVDPYPIWSMLPHAVCIRGFGVAGYLVADILVNLAFLGALWLMLRAFRIGPMMALGVALLVTVGIPQDLLEPAKTARCLPAVFQLFFWDARIPRVFVTGVYVLLVWTCLIRMATDRMYILRPAPWFGLGFSLSLLLQSDTFAGVNGCILAGVATIAILARNHDAWRRILLYATLAAATFAVTSIPLFLQQALTHPDAIRRYGIFTVPRSKPLVSFACHRQLAEVGLLTVAAFFLYPWIRRNGPAGPRLIRLQVLLIAVAVVVSFLALPISCVVLGKAGHVYHFDMFIEVTCSYAVLLLLLLPFGDWGRDEAGPASVNGCAGLRGGVATASIYAVLLVSAAAVVWQVLGRPSDPQIRWLVPHATGDAAQPSNERYWSDFREMLHRFQHSPELRSAEVLGALDTQVLNWWGGFGPRWQFVAQAWLTPGSDQIQEGRLLVFCRLLGLRDDQLPQFLQLYYVKSALLGCAKYEASQGHTFSPMEDYEAADRAEILKKSIDDSWHLVVPKSELRRFERLYAQTSWRDCQLRLPDVIVLTACEGSLGLRPPESEYAEDFRNSTFTVWVRRAK